MLKLKPNEWGDEIILTLASNLWSVDIVVVPTTTKGPVSPLFVMAEEREASR